MRAMNIGHEIIRRRDDALYEGYEMRLHPRPTAGDGEIDEPTLLIVSARCHISRNISACRQSDDYLCMCLGRHQLTIGARNKRPACAD